MKYDGKTIASTTPKPTYRERCAYLRMMQRQDRLWGLSITTLILIISWLLSQEYQSMWPWVINPLNVLIPLALLGPNRTGSGG